jgi:hypothetical protein
MTFHEKSSSLMFAFILAETVRYAIEIRAYRRGVA